MARVLIYGSSTAYGLWGNEEGAGGYAELLKHSLMQDAFENPGNRLTPVYNRAQTAESIGRTVLALGHDSSLAFDGQRGRAIGVFMLGAYDHVLRPGEHRPVTSRVRFLAELGQLVEMCDRADVIPVFLGLPPLDEEHTLPVKATGEVFCDDDRREYEAMVRDHAKVRGHAFVEIYNQLGGKAFREKGYASFDKLHINGKAHQVIHDALLPVIRDILYEPGRIADVVLLSEKRNPHTPAMIDAASPRGIVLQMPVETRPQQL